MTRRTMIHLQLEGNGPVFFIACGLHTYPTTAMTREAAAVTCTRCLGSRAYSMQVMTAQYKALETAGKLARTA